MSSLFTGYEQHRGRWLAMYCNVTEDQCNRADSDIAWVRNDVAVCRPSAPEPNEPTKAWGVEELGRAMISDVARVIAQYVRTAQPATVALPLKGREEIATAINGYLHGFIGADYNPMQVARVVADAILARGIAASDDLSVPCDEHVYDWNSGHLDPPTWNGVERRRES